MCDWATKWVTVWLSWKKKRSEKQRSSIPHNLHVFLFSGIGPLIASSTQLAIRLLDSLRFMRRWRGGAHRFQEKPLERWASLTQSRGLRGPHPRSCSPLPVGIAFDPCHCLVTLPLLGWVLSKQCLLSWLCPLPLRLAPGDHLGPLCTQPEVRGGQEQVPWGTPTWGSGLGNRDRQGQQRLQP